MSDALFPTSSDSKPPVYYDGQDAVGVYDLNWVSDMLGELQTAIGEDPGDRATDMEGKNFGSLAANFRALCRMKTGNTNETVGWAGVITVDGETFVYFGSGYFLYFKLYFLDSLADSLFTEPPIFIATCRGWTAYASGSDSGSYESIGAWRTTRSYCQFMGHGVNSDTWTSGGGAKDLLFDWLAIQPLHGRTESDGGPEDTQT